MKKSNWNRIISTAFFFLIISMFPIHGMAEEQVHTTSDIEKEEKLQYQTDFSEYEVGTVPNDWSYRWSPSNWSIMQGSHNLLVLSSGSQSGRWALSWDEVGQVEGDVEMFGIVSADTEHSLFSWPIYISGGPGEETGYFFNANINLGTLRIGRYNEGDFSELASKEYDIKL